MEPAPAASPTPNYICREIKKVELVDLTVLENAQNITLKEGEKPFKVVLTFKEGKLRIHLLELPNNVN